MVVTERSMNEVRGHAEQFLLTKEKRKKRQCTALKLFLHFLCINRVKLVLPLRHSNQLSKVRQPNLPDKIRWVKIRLNKNKAMLFGSSPFSFNILGIASGRQRTFSRRFCKSNSTYKLTCRKLSITQFKIRKIRLQFFLNTGSAMQWQMFTTLIPS